MDKPSLIVHPATAEALAPYGTLIEPGEDGLAFGPQDATLVLTEGTPRLYIMSLVGRPLVVKRITRHRRVTQCLAAMEGRRWYIVLAPPDGADDPDAKPDVSRLAAFAFSGTQAVALHRGTWHAGPLFSDDRVNFLNLELADTNLEDHHTEPLDKDYSLDLSLLA